MSELSNWLNKIHHPAPGSRKGQNGKALIIGGSDLFHAASQWSFKAASRWVDMLFYSSVVENNELLKAAKLALTDGVVIPRSELASYLQEVDAALIGPGMRRDTATRFSEAELHRLPLASLNSTDWETDTQAITAAVLQAYPQKKWVIDAGALQVLDLAWLPPGSLLTPHLGEFEHMLKNWAVADQDRILESVRSLQQEYERSEISQPGQVFSLQGAGQPTTTDPRVQLLQTVAQQCNQAIIVLKGRVDIIFSPQEVVVVRGGNAGLTKGGTGDVLAGLTLGLLTTSEKFPSVVVAAVTLKQAAHDLYQERQEMFDASDVVEQLPKTFASWQPTETRNS